MKIEAVGILLILLAGISLASIGIVYLFFEPSDIIYNYIMIDSKEFSVIHDRCDTFHYENIFGNAYEILVNCFYNDELVFTSIAKNIFISDTIGELLP
jgi:hypothetical protein